TKTSRIHARRPAGCIYLAYRCGMGDPKQRAKPKQRQSDSDSQRNISMEMEIQIPEAKRKGTA
ncbi:hypothetical protein, partial [Xanthomonas sp. LMC-A-07]|uniref:hypothetical protein n=1 Tax=Xanthomonas sp. LMC-A-07 TaxID=3040329 RepID=UPI0025547C08